MTNITSAYIISFPRPFLLHNLHNRNSNRKQVVGQIPRWFQATSLMRYLNTLFSSGTFLNMVQFYFMPVLFYQRYISLHFNYFEFYYPYLGPSLSIDGYLQTTGRQNSNNFPSCLRPPQKHPISSSSVFLEVGATVQIPSNIFSLHSFE